MIEITNMKLFFINDLSYDNAWLIDIKDLNFIIQREGFEYQMRKQKKLISQEIFVTGPGKGITQIEEIKAIR